jgi:hypothetical protein
MIKINLTSDISFLKLDDLIEIRNSIYYNGSYKIIDINYNQKFIFVYHGTSILQPSESYNHNYVLNISNSIYNYSKKSDFNYNFQSYLFKPNNDNPVKYNTLELNGIQRFYKLDGSYCNYVQPYQHNSKTPNDGINIYSFCLKSDEYQPTGFCNFSRLNLKVLITTLNEIINKEDDIIITVIAYGYNILKCSYGKAGLMLNI